jgi:hypothetical protein
VLLGASEPARFVKKCLANSGPKYQRKYSPDAWGWEGKNYYRSDKYIEYPTQNGSVLGQFDRFSPSANQTRLPTLPVVFEKASQFQEAVNGQTKPEIDQSPDIKLVRMMLGGRRQIGVEGKIEAIAKQDGNQIFGPFHS